jgi:type IV pilus assembly protein PilF
MTAERGTWMPALRWATIALALVACLGLPSSAAAREQKVDKKTASQFKLAQQLYDAGRLAEALTAVDRSLEETSRYAPARLLRGMILYRRGAMEEALAEFTKAVDIDKEYTDARIYKGSALANLKRPDDAMKEFQIALKDLKYPWPERVHGNIGMLKRERGDLAGAVESLQTAVKMNPSYGRGYFELGVTYDAMNRPADALRAYQDALVSEESRPELHLRLGLALIKAGSEPKAREHLQKVLNLSPDGPEATQARDAIARLNGAQKPS